VVNVPRVSEQVLTSNISADFAREIMGSLDYYLNHRAQPRYYNRDSPDFGSAFGITGGNDRLPYKRYRAQGRVHHISLGEMQVIGAGRGGSRDSDVSPAPPPYIEDTDWVPPEKPGDVHLDSKSQW
jgi:hypothetical protein